MTSHAIIDNRNVKLVDRIQQFLPESERAKFAVGYFFLSGLEALGTSLDEIGELRLLIGNTTNRETIEQLAEAYKRLELVEERAEETRAARPVDRRQRAEATAGNVRDAVSVMDQTDSGEALVHALIRMVEDGRLKVRVYTRGRLHAKAYIFDWRTPTPGNAGIAIVGSSNLTLSGVSDNTELNVIVHDENSSMTPGGGNHGQLTAWFNELWDESQDFEEHLMRELRASWAGDLARPYDIYMKTLYTLVADRLDEGDTTIIGGEKINRSLADFQKVAVRQAVRMIREHRGCFVADVVGLGKSYIGAAIVKHFEQADRKR
ncbi:MAG: phospholipase D-like domain-containing protein, partial [Thermomicrobiales bacterium]